MKKSLLIASLMAVALAQSTAQAKSAETRNSPGPDADADPDYPPTAAAPARTIEDLGIAD